MAWVVGRGSGPATALQNQEAERAGAGLLLEGTG